MMVVVRVFVTVIAVKNAVLKDENDVTGCGASTCSFSAVFCVYIMHVCSYDMHVKNLQAVSWKNTYCILIYVFQFNGYFAEGRKVQSR